MDSGETRPKRTEGLVQNDLGDEFLVYDEGGDRIHVLNVTARELFLMCDGKTTISAMAAELTRRFEVEEATARQDVETTLEQLRGLGLVSVD